MTKNEILLDIANRRLGVKTFEVRSEFYQLPVSWIKKALEEAFDSGMELQADIYEQETMNYG
jgi:hypothetical protein